MYPLSAPFFVQESPRNPPYLGFLGLISPTLLNFWSLVAEYAQFVPIGCSTVRFRANSSTGASLPASSYRYVRMVVAPCVFCRYGRANSLTARQRTIAQKHKKVNDLPCFQGYSLTYVCFSDTLFVVHIHHGDIVPNNRNPQKILNELRRVLNCDYATIAVQAGLRRQFIYSLRSGHVERPLGSAYECVENAVNDPRYVALDALCRQHGIEGLLDAVDTALRPQPGRPTRDDYREAFRAWQEFENTLSREGADTSVLNDPEVNRLSVALGQRLRELSK